MGLGRRTFAPGEVLTASNVMNYLQDQAVMNFAGTAARGSAIGTAVAEGMVSYLNDTDSLEVYRAIGTAAPGWNPVAFESYVNSRSGLIPVVPGTIANTSGSSSFNSSTGLVTFTGVSAISLNNIFTSTYKNYRLDYTITSATGSGGSLLLRLRSGGVNRTDSNHQTAGTQAQSTNVISSYAVNGGTSFDLGYMTVLSGSFTAGTMNISDPQETLFTKMVSSLIGVTSGNTTGSWQLGLAHHLAQSHDGFTLYTASGSLITGTLKVYGYN
jgi:hypothetical protein